MAELQCAEPTGEPRCPLSDNQLVDLLLATSGKKIRRVANLEKKEEIFKLSSSAEGLEEAGRSSVEMNFEELYGLCDGTGCKVPTSEQLRRAIAIIDGKLNLKLTNYSRNRDKSTVHRYEAEKIHEMMSYCNRHCLRKDIKHEVAHSTKMRRMRTLWELHRPEDCKPKVTKVCGTGGTATPLPSGAALALLPAGDVGATAVAVFAASTVSSPRATVSKPRHCEIPDFEECNDIEGIKSSGELDVIDLLSDDEDESMLTNVAHNGAFNLSEQLVRPGHRRAPPPPNIGRICDVAREIAPVDVSKQPVHTAPAKRRLRGKRTLKVESEKIGGEASPEGPPAKTRPKRHKVEKTIDPSKGFKVRRRCERPPAVMFCVNNGNQILTFISNGKMSFESTERAFQVASLLV